MAVRGPAILAGYGLLSSLTVFAWLGWWREIVARARQNKR